MTADEIIKHCAQVLLVVERANWASQSQPATEVVEACARRIRSLEGTLGSVLTDSSEGAIEDMGFRRGWIAAMDSVFACIKRVGPRG